jgi:hypothetical protein
MLEEARRIVEAARRQSVRARLIGGLAVRAHCPGTPLCDRPARDIDLVVPHEHLKRLLAVLADLGYEENVHVSLASGGHAAQFFRACRHEQDGTKVHVDDRVDVYLDDFHPHHRIPLRGRLALADFALPPSDVLLIKLQRSSPDDDDLRDMLALLTSPRVDEMKRPRPSTPATSRGPAPGTGACTTTWHATWKAAAAACSASRSRPRRRRE